ncbi:MAG TPA: ABC transporter permease [Thermoanaerobaculia bacterium]|nr:ABC transporter permease [Thermoanaerobaculia bacterium]
MALIREIRLATRNLLRSPGFAAVSVAALALGIGANAAIFSLVSAVMLSPLPYPEAARLYNVFLQQEGDATRALVPERLPWSYPKFQTLREQSTPFATLAGFTDDSFNWTAGEEPQRLQGEYTSAEYFGLLGQKPILGRLFTAEEDSPAGDSAVMLLSERLWRRSFGGSREVLGRAVILDRQSFVVVGVLPAGFRGLSEKAELWIPLASARLLMYPEALTEEHNHWFEAIGRVAPEVIGAPNPDQLAAAGRAVEAAHPIPAEYSDGSRWTAAALPLEAARRDPLLRRALMVLLVAVGAVLLIACANLANLLLVRGAGRRRELALRTALGGTRWQLVRQLLTESLLLSVAGAAVGLLLAAWAVELLRSLRPEVLGGWGITSSEGTALAGAGLDGRVLVFCGLLVLLVPLLVGLVPALRAVRADLASGLKEGAAVLTGAALRRRGLGRGALVAAELALALVLLVGAGLLLRSFAGLARQDLGFRPEGVLTARFTPSSGDYDQQTGAQFHAQLVERLAALPGVVSASLATCAPASSGCNRTRVTRLDGRPVPLAEAPAVGVHFITPGHLRNLGVPILEGRELSRDDRPDTPRVAILSATAARTLWPGQSALGKRLAVGQGGFRGEDQAEVIAVVGDVRYQRLEEEPVADVYLSSVQTYPLARLLFVRTEGDPLALVPAVRGAVRELNPNLPLYSVRTMSERLGDALSRSRFASLLLAVFAGLALLLAAIGVYGVLAYTVAQRRREIGLRIALGAERSSVAGLVLRQGMALAGVGVGGGLALAFLGAKALGALLYGVGPGDPLTFVLVPLLLLAVALAACLVPALSAVRLEPMAVLGQDT